MFCFYYFLHNSKLGVPIKTTVSATVLEEALNGVLTIRPLPLEQPISKKVSCSYASWAIISLIVLLLIWILYFLIF